MLTGDLLLFRFSGGRFKIRFVDKNEPDLLLLAQSLIDCFADAANKGFSRNQLEEALELFRHQKELKVVDGLIKLLMDRTVFLSAQDIDYPALREKVFSGTSELLIRCGYDVDKFQACVSNLSGGSDLYGDLPGFEKIVSFPFIKPVDLLDRYNLALAQGMLFYTRSLKIKVSDPEPAELRRMLKYLKFFRLLAEVVQVKKNSLELDISGPFSLFGPTRKYALNLAVFLPAVVRLTQWKISADLEVGNRKGKFSLDDSSELVSHYRNFSAYVPEEVKMFHRLFSEKVDDWKIVGETPLLHAGKQEFIIPDISFENSDGTVIHLELFHRWHKAQLQQRINSLRQHDLPLILGIDRSILPNEEFEQIISQSPELKQRLFRFSDFPGIDTVHRTLRFFFGRKKSLAKKSG